MKSLRNTIGRQLTLQTMTHDMLVETLLQIWETLDYREADASTVSEICDILNTSCLPVGDPAELDPDPETLGA